jgi:hypothetical protein
MTGLAGLRLALIVFSFLRVFISTETRLNPVEAQNIVRLPIPVNRDFA